MTEKVSIYEIGTPTTESVRREYAYASTDVAGPSPRYGAFDRWLAERDLALRNAVLDDFAAGVPDDVKDWVDDYRIHQNDPAPIPE